jgi:hypothetical protein
MTANGARVNSTEEFSRLDTSVFSNMIAHPQHDDLKLHRISILRSMK